MTHTHQQTYLAKLGFSDPDKKNDLHDVAVRYLSQPEKLQKLAKLSFETWPDQRIEIEEEPKEWQTVSDYRESDAQAELTKDQLEEISVSIDSNNGERVSYHYAKRFKSWMSEFQICDVNHESSKPVIKFSGGQYSLRRDVVGFYDLAVSYKVALTIDSKVEIEVKRSRFWTSSWTEENTLIPPKYPEKRDRFLFLTEPGSKNYRKEVKNYDYCVQVEVKIGRVSVSDIIQQINTYSANESRVAFRDIVAVAWHLTPSEKRELLNANIIPIYLDLEALKVFQKQEKSETMDAF
jgi:gas vesicle protein